jgi:hypothetical protein
MHTETETKELVCKILEKMRPEELAVKMEISLGKLNNWRYGKMSADKHEFRSLKEIGGKI